MAIFDIAYKRLELSEGGYVNDPDDRGGETYKGIARKFHPSWGGWKIIDEVKAEHNTSPTGLLTELLSKNVELQIRVRKFYKHYYWDIIKLDDYRRQDLAEQIFDTAVNTGVSVAIKILQRLTGNTETGKWSDKLHDNVKNL